jgi:phenylpyruvate tautomerase PptA (4-oxalocrotonate tautomerase family)
VPDEEDRGHLDYGTDVPVLEVTALPQADGFDLAATCAALSEAVAAALDEQPEGTWVVWRTVPAGAYSEHRHAPSTQPRATHPPIVRVTAYEGRTPETIATVLAAVADTLVEQLGLEPGNVLVRWDEAVAGRLYSGGDVLGA